MIWSSHPCREQNPFLERLRIMWKMCDRYMRLSQASLKIHIKQTYILEDHMVISLLVCQQIVYLRTNPGVCLINIFVFTCFYHENTNLEGICTYPTFRHIWHPLTWEVLEGSAPMTSDWTARLHDQPTNKDDGETSSSWHVSTAISAL